MVVVTYKRYSLARKFLVFWIEDHFWEVVTHGAVTVIMYCREHQHALWHYRLMIYLIVTFSCIKIVFMSFSHSNELFRIIVSHWKGH